MVATFSVPKSVALTEYRAQRLTDTELCQLLGFDSRPVLDGFLKAHGVYLDYDTSDLDQDRLLLDRLGF